MASRTQIRASQITGSLGTHVSDGIVDSRDEQSAANLLAVTLPSGSLSGLLSETLSAIKRIHGGTTFANNGPGQFGHGLFVTGSIIPGADDAHDLGSADKAWQDLHLEGDILMTDAGKLETAAGDLTLSAAQAGADVAIDSANLVKLDADAGEIHIDDGGVTRGVIQFDNQDLVLSASTSDKDLVFAGNDGGTTIEALRLDMSEAGKAIFKSDIDIAAAGAFNIGATVGANNLTLGASNSTVIVPGNLTVQGDTTTLETANLIVEDPIVMLGSGAIGQNQQGGIAIVSGSNTASQAMVFGRVANDVWGVGRKDVVNGTVTTLQDMSLSNIRATQFELGGSGGSANTADRLYLDTNVILDATADIVLDADGDQISLKFGGATGQIDFTNENSGDGVIQQKVDSKDLVIQQYDGNEVVRFADDRKLYFFDKGGEHISSDGNILNISGDTTVLDTLKELTLDSAGIKLASGSSGTEIGAINFVGSDLYLSSSVSDKDMIFMVNDGGTMTEVARFNGDVSSLQMNNKAIHLSPTAAAGTIVCNGTDSQFTSNGNLKIESTVNEAGAVFIHTNGGSSETLLIQSSQGDTDSSIFLQSVNGGIKLQGGDQNDSIKFEDSPLELSSITAPTTKTNKLYALGSTLYWEDRLLATVKKVSISVSAMIASGTAVSSDGSHSSTTPLLSQAGGVNFEGMADGYSQCDIFVNGQLLLSGSDAQVGNGSADYLLFHTGSAKFGFSLEADDVITFLRH